MYRDPLGDGAVLQGSLQPDWDVVAKMESKSRFSGALIGRRVLSAALKDLRSLSRGGATATCCCLGVLPEPVHAKIISTQPSPLLARFEEISCGSPQTERLTYLPHTFGSS